jgi:hypothetical protein
MSLEWPPIPYAHSYVVYSSTDPSDFTELPISTIYTNSFVHSPQETETMLFYRVASATYRTEIGNRMLNNPSNSWHYKGFKPVDPIKTPKHRKRRKTNIEMKAGI